MVNEKFSITIYRVLPAGPWTPTIKKGVFFILATGTDVVSCGAENMKCYFPTGLPQVWTACGYLDWDCLHGNEYF